ncbi:MULTISPECIES: sodium:solute symporter [Xanthocytophaga]|uniref:Sodium:solute symporter n=1 Tax=Xanthocytophaga agilis TaxID=3048010 RepID=A0AAE3RBV7_9BACT|nr:MULTISPECIES: sodium:solute symporter [Xanthocytophaga]MDJ1473430.1 sodium:solute symporter [Xanthocytophaga flavus]MDJ1505435.1 sodium:solute symporter [Xanthocytophaga agilis]
MNPYLVLTILLIYFGVLILISYITSRGATTHTFFTAGKSSPWYLVAYSMIGTAISGVTFISVPGEVGNSQFSYLQFILGNVAGYMVVALVLMPVYYRMNLVSIYTYLQKRLGFWSYKSGAAAFLVSRTIGAAFRLFLTASVLQLALFDEWNVPFAVNVLITIALIWLITSKGGIKTILWTDAFQTTFLIAALLLSVYLISEALGLSLGGLIDTVRASDYSKAFFFDDPKSNKFFYKQFFAGLFTTVAMFGLDQDLMQKNLTCRNLQDAQKNMYTFSTVFLFVNILFLTLGALLYIYSNQQNIPIPAHTDDLYPTLLLKLNKFGIVAGVFFLLGITASSYASADSALASLTTSFCIDFLDFENRPEEKRKRLKTIVHLCMSIALLIVILIFKAINDQSVVKAVFTVAGYTYGPLLGLFSFGLLTKLSVKDRFVPVVCILSPILCYIINTNANTWLNGYKFGFELLILNGVLTFLGLLLLSQKKSAGATYG